MHHCKCGAPPCYCTCFPWYEKVGEWSRTNGLWVTLMTIPIYVAFNVPDRQTSSGT